MVSIVAGGKGTGKTKTLIKMANDDVINLKGDVVFIDDDNRHMYDLSHDLRFMCMEDFLVKSPEEFYGFVSGIISNNYDIQRIYVDGLLKIVDMDIAEVPSYIVKFKELGESKDLKFVFSLNCEKDKLPKELEEYLI